MTSEGEGTDSMRGKAEGLILRYFDETLAVEYEAIRDRRNEKRRQRVADADSPIGPPRPLFKPGAIAEETLGETLKLRREARTTAQPTIPPPLPLELPPADDIRRGGTKTQGSSGIARWFTRTLRRSEDRMRPQPYPRDLTGLALSGGGIRSAAFCLGALQALEVHKIIDGIDYLSTVSGGGYIGSSMTAAMSEPGPFPFQTDKDPRDTPAVGHVRNYSNYLMPRDRSGARNVSEAAVILLRGIIANAVIVAATLLLFATLTIAAYPDYASLDKGSYLVRLLGFSGPPFQLTLWFLALFAILSILWVLLRSVGWLSLRRATDNDADSPLLVAGRYLLVICVGLAFFDLQPFMIKGLVVIYADAVYLAKGYPLTTLLSGASAVVVGIGTFGNKLGNFLKTSQLDAAWTTILMRIGATLAIWAASALLLVLLYAVYLYLCAWGEGALTGIEAPSQQPLWTYFIAFLVTAFVSFFFKPNSFSLHHFYRDRLSRAFIFRSSPGAAPVPFPSFKLSQISATACPYHVVNAAMNVQASVAANQRGREADFFTFTRDFIGSDLTFFAATSPACLGFAGTQDMEKIDPALDLAAAMAISGAAISANMGANTIRPLSPTLALLNVRLGYWLLNPRVIAGRGGAGIAWRKLFHRLIGKFYLLLEMLNFLDETSERLYLTDGGHIENLGIYQLLKRGCQLIIAIDAECDPTLAFPSLVKIERYARIDFGVRIDLPWKEITKAVADGKNAPQRGPHCAIGRILYPDGNQGILLYVKSAVTGDETDYVLDYQKRNPRFPHETTGDQFFSEEQFEAYRALGFHTVDRVFDEADSDAIALSDAIAAKVIDLPANAQRTQPKPPRDTARDVVAWIRSMVAAPAAP